MPITFETVHTCVYYPWSVKSQVFHICKPYLFFHIFNPFSIPYLVVILGFFRNGHFKTSLSLKVLYQLKVASPRGTASSSIFTRPEQMSLVFHSVTEKWPFQDHLFTTTIVLSKSSVSQENSLNLCLLQEWLKALFPWDLNKWVESSPLLPKMFFSRPSCYKNYHMNSKICLQGEWLKWNTAALSHWHLKKWVKCSSKWQRNGLFKPFSHYNYHTDLKLCLLGEWLKWLNLSLPETWKNELNLPQYHREMALSRPSCH